ncbi:DUF1549 domain-containing protein [Rubripirellula reticaptiva]|uniref:WD domain, G-beta repeat n=1 Tax=Rubripirellula reticaptiva TaxID=2528013 RepID=A0A5C6F6L5_9BACT|nr:DUF1549 domain-containing protein [Rubripirellula reticaptiva]TWU55726.1 WD domain, G-beta repeat [Rubripirellula reticaptiva]
MRLIIRRRLGPTLCLLAACTISVAHASEVVPAEAAAAPVSYERDIEPIFSRACLGCHQNAKQLGSYVMTDFVSLIAGGETGNTAVVPGRPDESYLIDQIKIVDGHAEMPDEPFEPLSQVEIDTITQWISEGARNDLSENDAIPYSSENPPIYAAPPAMPSIDVSPDGKLIAVAGYHEVVLIDGESGDVVSRLIGMSPRINSVRFSPDGKRIAAAGGDPAVRGELQVWDVGSKQLLLSHPITYDAISGASWSPDGSKIAFGACDNVVRAVDAATGEAVLFQGAHDDWVRDTGFTPDGKHLISVGRDMSCKLTEVETERFVDNITSITPGALSGGLSRVVVHPVRDEILIGGADGIAKVYRVFRETARKIGDDANLILSLPKMPGRIFSVAISADASRLAAAATIDGHSEVRVWEYDFDGKVASEHKKILEKGVADRSVEETKLVNESRQKEIKEIARVEIPEAAVYAIAFAPDQSLLVTATDGQIRRVGTDGKVAATYSPFKVTPTLANASDRFDAKVWNDVVSRRHEKAAEETPPPADSIESIVISPDQIQLAGAYDYTQLIVTAVAPDGSATDITRVCDIGVPDWVTLTSDGLVRPVRDGTGELLVRYGDNTKTVLVSAAGISGDDAGLGAVDYVRDVNPVLSRLGCNSGTCHGAQKGKNGFRLSLRGYDPIFDLRALADDLSARRINAAAPEASLMLRKPLGTTPHQGGTLMTAGDPNHTILRRWIADGSKLDLDSRKVSHIEVFPINPIVQRTDAKQQVRVVAHYPDGVTRDVTREAFIESGNTEVATSSATGMLSAVRRGEAAILARYEGAYAATTLTVMGDRSGYQDSAPETWSRIDELVVEKWRRVKVQGSGLCDDATYLRRVHLDLTGLPPTSDQFRAFMADNAPTRIKRARIVDELIGSEAYIDFWTNKWADLLQVNRKFLGVEGSTKFRDWIRQSVATNKPYDQFAAEVLTATGSNNDNPPASYFKTLRVPEDTMENTTHLFLGIRFNCNKCHDHPFERWTQDQYYEMSAFFAHVGLEPDPTSGARKIGGTAVEGATPLFEKVVDKDSGDVLHPRTGKPVEPGFPFEVPHDSKADSTRRMQLSDWITDSDNPYFARSYVNRLWGYLLGVGLIEPIDDIRAGNPPTNPELLDHLSKTFVDSHFDVAHMLRTICNSRTYQLDVAVNPMNQDDRLNYSHALPRRLPAEVIYDSVHSLTGSVSDIPGVPAGTRAAALSDSGVKLNDGFLQNLGRPSRESACECERSSGLQLGPVMALISGPTIGSAIADPKNDLASMVKSHPDDRELVKELFIRAIGRTPTDSEFAAYNQATSLIGTDHQMIMQRLGLAEKSWATERAELEKARESKLAATAAKIEARIVEMQPEREKLEAERLSRIKTAQQKFEVASAKIDEIVANWAKQVDALVEWHPLAATKFSSTNKSVLTPQDDRSLVASGEKGKGIYRVGLDTKLSRITGFRIEAIAEPSLPSGGPGLGANGNFVLTELTIKAGPLGDAKKQVDVKIESGVADFTQDGFDIKKAFDGKTKDQSGWAVANSLGVTHWATFKLAEPISYAGGSSIEFELHQFHNAVDHRLGRFRISATTAEGEIPLGQPESFAAILATPADQRSDKSQALLSNYVTKTDAGIQKLADALAAAKAMVPPDKQLVLLQDRQAQLTKPTADIASLVQLRLDAAESAKQLDNLRLTAAEDLTWALINSPAFLFNH